MRYWINYSPVTKKCSLDHNNRRFFCAKKRLIKTILRILGIKKPHMSAVYQQIQQKNYTNKTINAREFCGISLQGSVR